MNTFKHFLLTEGRTHPINYNQAVDWARENCPQYLHNKKQNDYAIYRGSKSSQRIVFGDPSQFNPRVSANTSNEYTLLIDNLSNWSAYPKRGWSFICTTFLPDASDYGTPFLACPNDNAIVGVAPKSDLWGSFARVRNNENLRSSMDAFNYQLRQLIIDVTGETNLDIKTFDQLNGYINHVQQMINKHGLDQLYDQFSDTRSKKFLVVINQFNGNVFETLEYLLDPEANGFDKTYAKDFTIKGTREVWFSSPAVFVYAGDSDNFVDEVLGTV